jgi:alpha-1,6-mannosyltransferase
VFFAVACVHLFASPFTKVEESFNLQATHDLLFRGPLAVREFDHVEHPGVVPRSFVGAVVLAALAAPFRPLLDATALFATKLAMQVVVRLVLAFLSALALSSLVGAVEAAFSRRTAQLTAVVIASQFHVLFYASRTLPNTYAQILVTCAFAAYMRGRVDVAVALLIASTAIFRSELALLAVPLIVQLLALRQIALGHLIKLGVGVSLLSLALTVCVDSYLWQRWLYPEGELFVFNAVHGKSILWGASPWHWYASSALPRAVAAVVVLIPFGIAAQPRRLAQLLFAPTAFVALYSFMPHKELRFVLYVVPLLAVCAGVALDRAVANAQRAYRAACDPQKAAPASRWRHYAALALGVGAVLATALSTVAFSHVSSLNYPGGVAFARAHRLLLQSRANDSIALHIDVAAAQTGVSRFGERRDWGTWTYSKDERRPLDTSPFTHLLGERADVDGFRVIQSTAGFDGLERPTAANGWWPVRVSDRIHLLERIAPTGTTGKR